MFNILYDEKTNTFNEMIKTNPKINQSVLSSCTLWPINICIFVHF